MSTEAPTLASWNDLKHDGTGAREAIEAFVAGAVEPGGDNWIDPAERIAVFDNDGTLWSEQPFYFQQAFIEDRRRLGTPMREESVQDFAADVRQWIGTARHPDKNCLYTDLVFQPMLELLSYLRFHGFKTFIVSGGGMDFVRPWAEAVYGIPPEQVIGSSVGTAYRDASESVVRLPHRSPGSEEDAGKTRYQEVIFFDDRYGKPVGIERHIGRRPVAAFGNSDGDKQMLEWTTADHGSGVPRFGLLVHHTDGEREWQYDEGSKQGGLSPETLEEAATRGWTVVDMAKDWAHVSPPLPQS